MKANPPSARSKLILASSVFAAVLVAAFAAVSSARAQDAGPDNAAAPEVGIWVPSTPQTFTYVVPYTTGAILVGPFVVRVSNSVGLITNSAYVDVCFPASSCTEHPVSVSFPTTSSAIMTATNIPLLGTGQTMQFFISPVAGRAYASPRHQFVRRTVLYLPMLMRTYSISGRVINAFGQGVANVRGWSNVSGFSALTDGSGFYAINDAVVGSNFVQITGTTGFPNSPDSAPAFNPEFRLPVLPPSAVNQDFVWRDDNPCRAIDAQPGVNYVVNRTDPADAYDFLRLNVTGTTPLVITMTNVQSPGQLQLRGPIKNVNNCSPTTGTDLVNNYFKVFSPTAGTTNQVLNVGSIPGGLYFARFNLDAGATRSATPYNFAWAIGNTSNNNSCSAQGISLGAVVQETPDDAEDWFFFDVGSSSTIVITMTNFTATGQYNIVRQTGDCSQFTWPPLLVQNGTPNLTTMTLFNQPAGRYFFRVATTANFNSTPYTFRVTSTTGGTEAAVDTCPAFQGCQANVPNGGTLTIYWRGMSGASFLRITLKSWGLVGCNLGNPDTARPTGYTGNGGNVPFNPLPDSGAFSFNSFSTGGYAFFADANPTSRPTFHDEKTFRVGCGFLNGIWPTEPEPIGPQESEVTVETDVTPVPLPENPDMTPPDVPPAP